MLKPKSSESYTILTFIKTTQNSKFKFPEENINQSDNGNYWDYRSTEIIISCFVISLFYNLQREK